MKRSPMSLAGRIESMMSVRTNTQDRLVALLRRQLGVARTISWIWFGVSVALAITLLWSWR